MQSELDKEIKSLAKKLKTISTIDVKRANSSALNKAAGLIRTRTVRGVAKKNKLKQKVVRDRIYIKRSTARTQEAKLNVYTRDVSVVSLLTPSQRGKVGRGTNRKGVRAAGRQFDGAFIQRSGGSLQVFKRKGRARLPIEVVRIPIRKDAEIITRVVTSRVMKDRYPELLKTDLNFRLLKHKTK